MALTPKQEKFCLKYIETGNASEAYRLSYDAGKMKPNVINVKASELLASGKVAVRISELRKPLQQVQNITLASLLIELEEARDVAKESMKAAAMVAATMGKAKLAGLDKPAGEGSNELESVINELISKLPS